MSVLDELREMVETTASERADDANSAWMLVSDWLLLLDAFEAAHPGLRDFTAACPNCGRAYDPPGEIVTYWWGGKGACSSIVLCLACAKEARDA